MEDERRREKKKHESGIERRTRITRTMWTRQHRKKGREWREAILRDMAAAHAAAVVADGRILIFQQLLCLFATKIIIIKKSLIIGKECYRKPKKKNASPSQCSGLT